MGVVHRIHAQTSGIRSRLAPVLPVRVMRFSFETLGNASLASVKDDRPVLATDPWLTGTCYFGSWGLTGR